MTAAAFDLEIRALWAEGMSTRDMGLRLGLTKNAVIGRAHRMHLTPRPSPINLRLPRRAPKIKRAPRVTLKLAPPVVAAVVVAFVRGCCAWPVSGERRGTVFCADGATRGPYCAAHAARAYVVRSSS